METSVVVQSSYCFIVLRFHGGLHHLSCVLSSHDSQLFICVFHPVEVLLMARLSSIGLLRADIWSCYMSIWKHSTCRAKALVLYHRSNRVLRCVC